MIIRSVLDNLEWGRNFLRNSQLRSLRNLSWMPYDARVEVISSLNIGDLYKHMISVWLDQCMNLPFSRTVYDFYIWTPYPKEGEDDYLYCYTPQLELTQHGQRMKDETYRAQARA